MLSSLIIKLVMFAATLGVVFWIGWSLPMSADRAHDLGVQSFDEAQADIASNRQPIAEVSPASVAFVPNQPSTAAVPKRSPSDLLDVNRATEQDFDSLPGIGSRLAERIIAYRKSAGGFHSLDELRQVKGIGRKKFERIRPLITVMSDDGSVRRGKKGT